jgi:zinc protease
MRFLPTLALALCLASPCFAKPPLPEGITQVTSVEGITEYRLPNGMTALLMPDASKPTMTVNVTYRVGSRHENYGETGMAHLLEHLLFKGSPKFPSIDKEFNARGARANGTTWLDRTNYYELLQASDDNLRWALELEADRMVNAFIAKKDLDSEMTVVRNEYEAGENSPFQVMLKRLQSVAYDWHSYGRSTIGNRSDIENVRIENLQAFYRTYYQPDNAVLVLAGKFDADKALTWIAQYFGAIPKPTRTLPPFWTVEPTQDGERSFMVRRKGEMQIVLLVYKVPSALHADAAGIFLANEILGYTPSGRLHKALVETKLATQVLGFPLVGAYPGLHILGAVVKKGDPVEPVQAELIRVVEELAAKGPTDEEMTRAKQAYANQFEKTLADHEQVGVALSEYIALGDWRLFFVARDRIAAAGAGDVTRAAGAYYRRDNRTVGRYVPEDAPQRAEVPAAPTLAEVMKDFRPRAAMAVGEAFDPSQENIEKRTVRERIGGLKVAMLPKKTRGETVNVSLRLHSGDAQSLTGKAAIGSLTQGMILRGTSKLSRTQITDQFERLKVSGDPLNFQTTRPNLVEALRLMAHALRDANFPQDEFEQLVKQQLTALEAQKSEPRPRAIEAINQHFNRYPKGDPRHSPTLDEQIAAIRAVTLAEVKAFHREFFAADLGELAIVGDFDPEAVRDALRVSLADWRGARPFTRIDRAFADVSPINRWVNTPDKENAVFAARLNVDLRDDDPDFPALFLVNYMLGGGAGLNSRLAERIRQKDGLSYGIGSQLIVSATDRAAHWQVLGIAAPQNIGKVEAAFKEEIERARTAGFTEDELARAKAGALQLRAQQRAQDASLAAAWVALMHVGRDMGFSKRLDERIAALTKADVDAAMRKYLVLDKMTIVKAGDMAKVR